MNGIRSRPESRPQPGKTQFVRQDGGLVRRVAEQLAEQPAGATLRSCSVCHTLFEVPAGAPVEPGERYCSKACRRVGHRRRTT